MTSRCQDIRAYARFIHMSMLTALTAAIASYAEGQVHGSHANNNMLNAIHWLLVIVLVGEHAGPKRCHDISHLVWFIYGILFGELDMEDAACTALIVASAASYIMHRRLIVPRQVTEATATPEADDFTAAC